MPSRRLPLVVFTSALPGGPERLFEGIARVKVFKGKGVLSEENLAKRIGSARASVTLLSDPVTERVLLGCPNLRIVANYAMGYNNIDVRAARRLGIAVTHTPDVLTEATADTAWALILSCARRVCEGDRMVRAGRFRGWAPGLLLGMDLRGKVLGVVGMGRIGKAVARRSGAFGMNVAYTQRHRLLASEEAALGARFLPLESLLGMADIVSLHCPFTPETRRLLSAERLAMMKPGAILINTARGAVVDEAALVEALRSGRLFAAGLDVYEEEPALAPGLAKLPNVVLLPHLGSAGAETRAAMAQMAARDVLEVLAGRPPLHPIPEQ